MNLPPSLRAEKSQFPSRFDLSTIGIGRRSFTVKMDAATLLQDSDAMRVAIVITTLLLVTYYALTTTSKTHPRVNTPSWLDLWSRKARQSFIQNAEELVKEGFSKASQAALHSNLPHRAPDFRRASPQR